MLNLTEEGKDRNDNSKELPLLPTSGLPLVPTSGLPLVPTSGLPLVVPTSASSRPKTSSECSYEPEDTYEMPSWERPIVPASGPDAHVTADCGNADPSYLDIVRGGTEEEGLSSDVTLTLCGDLEEGSLTRPNENKRCCHITG